MDQPISAWGGLTRGTIHTEERFEAVEDVVEYNRTHVNANFIIEGTLSTDRIADGSLSNVKLAADISATKITRDQLDNARLPDNISVLSLSGVGTGVTNLDADNIDRGLLIPLYGGTGRADLTANKILVGNGGDAIATPTLLHWDSTNTRLGVGTAAPATTLDVNGTIRATGGDTSTLQIRSSATTAGAAGVSQIELYANPRFSNGDNGVRLPSRITSGFIANSNWPTAHMKFDVAQGNGGALSNHLFLQNNRAGFGTSNPTQRIHAEGNILATGEFLGVGSNVTQLNASNITLGFLNPARIQALSLSNGLIADVSTDKLTGFVSPSNIQDLSLSNVKIYDLSADKLTGFIQTSNIQDLSLSNAKINDLDAAKLFGILNPDRIANLSLGNEKIADLDYSKIFNDPYVPRQYLLTADGSPRIPRSLVLSSNLIVKGSVLKGYTTGRAEAEIYNITQPHRVYRLANDPTARTIVIEGDFYIDGSLYTKNIAAYGSNTVATPGEEGIFYDDGADRYAATSLIVKGNLYVQEDVWLGEADSFTTEPTYTRLVLGSENIATGSIKSRHLDVSAPLILPTTIAAQEFYENGQPLTQKYIQTGTLATTDVVSGVFEYDRIPVITPQKLSSITGTGSVVLAQNPVLSNATFQGDVFMNQSTLTVRDLNVIGTSTVINTDTQITDQLVINNAGTGPALQVTQSGAQPVANFIDAETSSALYIADNGLVGIKTTTPQHALDVNGIVKATSFQGTLATSNLFGTISPSQLSSGIPINKLEAIQASNINGVFQTAQIPNLDASKVSTGTFQVSQIPSLPISKLTTGTLPVTLGGTGATTLTGYLFGNGSATISGSATIPGSAISGAVASASLANETYYFKNQTHGTCEIKAGTGDGASNGIYNLAISSWQGIGFPYTFSGVNKIHFDVRSGDIRTDGRFVGNGSAITSLNMGAAGSGVLATAYGGTGTTTSTGTGANVLSGSPTLTGETILSGGALGNVVGNSISSLKVATTAANQNVLQIFDYRHTAGTNWEGTSTVIRKQVDATAMGYIEFNPPGGQYGMAFGTWGFERMRLMSSGYVGIGSTAPAGMLDVRGSYGIGGHKANMVFTDNAAGFGGLLVDHGATYGNLSLLAASHDPFKVRVENNPAFVVSRYGGQVGIGTDAPSQKLHVTGNVLAGQTFIGDVGYGNAYAAFAHKDKASPENYSLLHTNWGQTILNTAAGQSMDFRCNNANTMLITGAGNVGIGNENPANKLEVNGNIKCVGGFFIGDGSQLTNLPGAGSGGGNGWSLSGTNVTTADLATNVGIGTATPGTKLDVVSTTPVIKVRTATGGSGWLQLGNAGHGVGRNIQLSTLTDGNDVTVHTAGSGSLGFVAGSTPVERMRILPSGDVGIGTNAPTSLLQVQGNIRVVNSGSVSVMVGSTVSTGLRMGSVGSVNNFATGTAIGDGVIRQDDSTKKMHFICGNVAPTMTLVNGSLGINTLFPTATLDVVGGVKSSTGFTGPGGSLTGLNASAINTGTLANAHLPAAISATLSGDGAGITNLNASSLATGTVPNARLPSTIAISKFQASNNDTAAAPGFSWVGDTNTGMFQQAADVIGFSTNGVERVRLTNEGFAFSSNASLDLGLSDPSREVNAGKIAYKKFSTNALDIVGAGNASGNRTVRVYDNLVVEKTITAETLYADNAIAVSQSVTGLVMYANSFTRRFGLSQGAVRVTRIFGTISDLNSDHFEISGSAFPITGLTSIGKETFNTTVTGDVGVFNGRVMEYIPFTTAFNDVWLHEWWDDLGTDSGVLVIKLRADDDATVYYCGSRVLDLNGNTTRETVVPIQQYAHFQVLTRNGGGTSLTRVNYYRLFN